MFIHQKQNRNALKTFFFLLIVGFISFNVVYGQDHSVKTNSVATASQVVRKAPYLIFNGNSDEMVVLWQLTTTTTCTIEWGTDTNYSTGSATTSEYGSDHQHKYVIDNLAPHTKYYYKVTVGSENYYGSFYSAPQASATQMKFIAYGDTRSHPEDHDKVAQGILGEVDRDPEFQSVIISTGDLVYDGDREYYWDSEFFNQDYTNIIEMLSKFPYLSCRGNHEVDGTLFKKYFPLPFVDSFYWSFDYGPAHFVVVDQYIDYSTGSDQYNWIDNDLNSSTKPWKFIYLHEPGWSAGGHSNNEDVQDYIQPLCEKYHVPIVFAGHNHYYARAEVNNVMHITTGGGGAPLYDPDPSYPNIVTATKAHHYCKVVIDDNRLYFSAYDDAGAKLDSFMVERHPSGLTYDDMFEPTQFSLKQNYPNPFNPRTSIEFSIAKKAFVKLKVYDVHGQEISTLVSSQLNPGRYNYSWDGSNHPSGIYFYRLEAGDFVKTGKMTLLK